MRKNNILIPRRINSILNMYDNSFLLSKDNMNNLARRLRTVTSDKPIVSVVIIAYNEEKGILKSIASFAEMKSKYPFELLVVNNNSSDKTQEILDKCGVNSIFQPKQGVGFARQAGMDNCKGKYMICCDADTIYPETYIDAVMEELSKPKIAGVYGLFSFLPEGNMTRVKLFFYEYFKYVVIKLRSLKRPELCVGGASFAIDLEFGRRIMWNTEIKRGEDGSMAFELKKYGKVKLLTKSKTKVWTSSRILLTEGSLVKIIFKRIRKEISRVSEYFVTEKEGYFTVDSNKI